MRIARVLIGILVAAPLYAATPALCGDGFRGKVVDKQGKPVSGALVSARNRAIGRSTSAYTAADGKYALPGVPDGVYDVRARHFGYKDANSMAVAAGGKAVDLTLAVETDEYDRFGALPSNRWFALALAEMPSEQMREEFDRQCTFCHQQGSWATRVERTPEHWEKIFSLMARMGGVLSPETRQALPAILNKAYTWETAVPKLKAELERHPLPTGAGLAAVIDEWEVGDRASVQHDIVVHPAGYIYSVDTTKDFLYRLDPRTNERKAFKIPDGGLPLGGVFGNSRNVLPPNADAHVAPHSLQVAPDGKLWVTLCLGNKVGVFDPKKESWTLIDQWDGLYPHTIRFDRKGRAWYTLAVSNQVAMIDPASGEKRTIRLPGRTWKQSVAARVATFLITRVGWAPATETASPDTMLPVPYGIDIAPDGGVWFSQLNIQRIGRIDPETGSYELYDTPFPGPRRLRFDSQGNLWIPGFSAGLLARFNPKTKQFKTWDLPTEPKGTETPYALNVDRKTDIVWICGTNSDTLIRFDPKSEKFTIFPLPTRVTYTREIDFDDQGGIWTSNSNTPGWHIETENPQIIRLLEHGVPTAKQVAAAK
jgi:streptogramin lyase